MTNKKLLLFIVCTVTFCMYTMEKKCASSEDTLLASMLKEFDTVSFAEEETKVTKKYPQCPQDSFQERCLKTLYGAEKTTVCDSLEDYFQKHANYVVEPLLLLVSNALKTKDATYIRCLIGKLPTNLYDQIGLEIVKNKEISIDTMHYLLSGMYSKQLDEHVKPIIKMFIKYCTKKDKSYYRLATLDEDLSMIAFVQINGKFVLQFLEEHKMLAIPEHEWIVVEAIIRNTGKDWNVKSEKKAKMILHRLDFVLKRGCPINYGNIPSNYNYAAIKAAYFLNVAVNDRNCFLDKYTVKLNALLFRNILKFFLHYKRQEKDSYLKETIENYENLSLDDLVDAVIEKVMHESKESFARQASYLKKYTDQIVQQSRSNILLKLNL